MDRRSIPADALGRFVRDVSARNHPSLVWRHSMSRLHQPAACAALLVSLILASPAAAQVFTEPSTTVSLSANDARVLLVAPGETNGLLEFTADPQAAGGDLFDVVSQDPHAVEVAACGLRVGCEFE